MRWKIARDEPTNAWQKIYSLFSPPHKFCVYPCMGKRKMKIVNKTFQLVISSVLSSTKYFNESRVCEKMYLAKTGKSWKKYQFVLCSLSTFDFLRFLFVFAICIWLIMWYFFISSQLKGLNIRINDLKMHFSILL